MSEQLGAGASMLPDLPDLFGQSLRRLRGKSSLRRLASTQADRGDVLQLSKSQLARYEGGQTLPPVEYAPHLDQLYDAEGWIDLALRSLWRTDWDPWASERGGPSRIHSVVWPAQLSGVVWLKIVPQAEDVGVKHHIDLEWGPWTRSAEVKVPRSGALLFTGKASDPDGIARTCNVTLDRRVFLMHGAGDRFEDEAAIVDLRRGWRIANGETATSTSPGE